MQSRLFSLLVVCPVAAAVAATYGLSGLAAHHQLTVGILEDDHAENLNTDSGPSQRRVVRIAFAKSGSDWILAQPSAAAKTDWTIAFDGRNLGAIQSTPPQKRQPGWDDVQDVVNASVVPQIGKPSRKFGQSLGLIVRRPLIVVSEPNFEDPDGWRPGLLSPTLDRKVRRAFQEKFPSAKKCDYRNEAELPDRWDYTEADLRLTDVYRSNAGAYLVHTRPAKGPCGYTDDAADPYADQWFLVSGQGEVMHIGSFMELVDAGDYDRDGKSEVIFSYGRPEDEDGYILFYDNFRKQIKLSWTYH